MIRVISIQTRDCFYHIYHVKETNFNFMKGYYFFDDELEEYGAVKGNYGQGYIGPFKTLDEVCKAQHRHWKAVQPL